MLPGNATCAPAYPAAPGPGAFIAGGGLGPGVDQVEQLDASVTAGMFAGAVTQGRPVGESADINSPQRFVTRPSLADLVDPTQVGDDTAAEALPGRMYPAAFDDGENYGRLS